MNSYPMPNSPRPAPHSGSTYISNIILNNYRNHAALSLDCASPAVILTGANGAGKTNILEAISLFAPGRGLRGASIHELSHSQPLSAVNHHFPTFFVVADLVTPYGTHKLGTGIAKPGDRARQIHADEKPISQSELADYVTLAWATPDMDRIWVDSASARRRLIDRLAYAVYPAHWRELNRLEKSRTERMKLLESPHYDLAWMNAVELAIAESSTLISKTRRDYIASLNQYIGKFAPEFPRLSISLKGAADALLQDQDENAAIQKMADQLRMARQGDAITRQSRIGAHRDDIAAWHYGKNRDAAECSTGEQKIALLSVLLGHAAMIREWRNKTPILLLDEINAHLDARHRAALAAVICGLGTQAWLSGADQSLFADYDTIGQFYPIGETI